MGRRFTIDAPPLPRLRPYGEQVMDEQMIEGLWDALTSFQSADGTWLQIGKSDFTRAAHSVMAGKVAVQQQRLEAAFIKGADVAVFIANQRQNPQPPTSSQLNEIADFVAAVRAAL